MKYHTMALNIMVALSIFGISLVACKGNAEKQEAVKTPQEEQNIIIDGHNSQNALDWVGEYKGTIPCADCEGIITTIHIEADHTYTKESKYMGREGMYEESGIFEWNRSGSVITLMSGEERRQYRVSENKIIHLDNEGHEIVGAMAYRYELMKQ